MLFDDLNKDYIAAYKARDIVKKDILSSIISKCKYKKVEKDSNGILTDEDVIKIIEKTIKELDEEILSFSNAGDNYIERVNNLKAQKEIINNYMPKQLSEEEIKNLINDLEDKSLPNVMKYFKTNYQGKCNMGLVSKIAKEIK